MSDNTLYETCTALTKDHIQPMQSQCTPAQSLEELSKEITERGNDMQVTHSKDGLKVFEVSKKLVKVIRS